MKHRVLSFIVALGQSLLMRERTAACAGIIRRTRMSVGMPKKIRKIRARRVRLSVRSAPLRT